MNLNVRPSNRLLYVTIIALTLLTPMLFLLTSREWLYAPVYMSDSYLDLIYSFFYNFGDYARTYYKASRVPWLAPLFYLQQLVGPHALTAVVVAGGWLLLGGLYFILFQRLFGKRRALVSLPWVMFFPHLVGLANGGGLYNNTGAILYFMASLILWNLRSTDEQSPKINTFLSIFAGFFIASCLFTNVIYVGLLFLFPITDHMRKRKWNSNHCLLALFGLILAMIFWGWINSLNDRQFFFFIPMLRKVENLVLNPEKQQMWWHPISEVLHMPRFDSVHLVFLGGCYFLAMIKLALSTLKERCFPKDILAWHYIALCSVWILLHMSGSTTLTPPDFSYPLQVPAFLMLISWTQNRDLSAQDIWFTLGSIPLLWMALYLSQAVQRNLIASGYNASLLLIICSIVLMFCMFLLPGDPKAKLGYYLVAAMMYSLISFDPRIDLPSDCSYRSDSHDATINIVTKLLKLDNTPGKFIFYAYKGDPVATDSRCLYNRFLNQDEFARLPSLLMGEVVGRGDFSRSAPELSAYDFGVFQAVKHSHLVLFPFDSPTFSADFLARAKELGYETEKVMEDQEYVLDYKIPYEVYNVKSIPNY